MSKNLIFLTSKVIRRPPLQSSRNISSNPVRNQSTQPLGLTLPACVTLLQSCANQRDLEGGQQLHAHMLISGLFHSSPLSTTSLINMYSKCSISMSDAFSVFLSSTHCENVFAYNAVIAGFISHGLHKHALEFYHSMRKVGLVPDKFTFPCVIKDCWDVLAVEMIHSLVFKVGLEFDLYIGSALMHAYLRFGLSGEALRVFDELPERGDVVIWNALINGFAQVGEVDMAMGVFRRMVDSGVGPNRFSVTGILSVFAMVGEIYNGKVIHGFVIKMGYDLGIAVPNALIDMYGKCKCVMDAVEVFVSMDAKDIFSWNSIICVHEQCGEHEETLRLFKKMLRASVRPDLVTVASVLLACSHLAALGNGREMHGYIIMNGLVKNGCNQECNDIYINNAVMDMYAKSGNLREARLIFDKMSSKDTASWNIMIIGYGMQGSGNEALELFYSMSKAEVKLDEVTFVGVLSACSHVGFVRQGREFFASMQPKYGVLPTLEHYSCVIDMLGRAGQLEQAYELLSTMPYEANPVIWRAFLSASQLHGNAHLAEIAAQQVFQLEPEHCGSYVILSNIYGASGRYEEVSGLRHKMRQQDVRKIPGCSWIELSNGLHAFVSGDRNHPEEFHIYSALDSLAACLIDHGYTPNFLEASM